MREGVFVMKDLLKLTREVIEELAEVRRLIYINNAIVSTYKK